MQLEIVDYIYLMCVIDVLIGTIYAILTRTFLLRRFGIGLLQKVILAVLVCLFAETPFNELSYSCWGLYELTSFIGKLNLIGLPVPQRLLKLIGKEE